MTWARNLTEWREQQAQRKEANLRALCIKPNTLHRGAMTRIADEVIPRPKSERAEGGAAEMAHKEKLVQLGCLVCRRIHGPHEPGPVQLHHYRGDGWGKGDWTTLIPLCVDHHTGPSGVHGLGTKGFAAHYGFSQADLLAEARRLTGLEVTA